MSPDELERRIAEMRSGGKGLVNQQQTVRVAALQIHKVPFDLNRDEQFIEIPAGLQVVSAEFEVVDLKDATPYCSFNIVGLSAPVNSQEPVQKAMMRVVKFHGLDKPQGTWCNLTHFKDKFAPDMQRVASCHLPDGRISYYIIGDMPELA